MNNRKGLILAASGLLALALCVMLFVGGFFLGQRLVSPGTDEAVTAVTGDEAEATTAVAASDDNTDTPQGSPAENDAGAETTPPDPGAETDIPPAEVQPQTPVDLDQAELDLLLEVWALVNAEFDGDLPADDDVIYAAIMGSLATLNDDYTRFIPADLAASVREQLQGNYEGIGAYVDLTEDGYLLIDRPIEGGPAESAGLLPGDVVTAVDSESILGLTLDEIITRVKGPAGTPVILTIQRPDQEPFEIEIIRARIEIPIVEAEMLEDDIGYIILTSFSGNAEEQVLAALETLLDQGAQGIILDLRNNPGGYLDQSVAIADIFLPEGVVLYERTRGGVEEVHRSGDGDVGEEIPLVVLVNSGSASASEIVAGAIQDRGRGVIIGELTFGKGSVQQVHTLSDGSELRVTIARFYSPDNNIINGQGITPDIEVEAPTEFGGPADGQLQRAIEYLLQGN